jgi:hypothetical protein
MELRKKQDKPLAAPATVAAAATRTPLIKDVFIFSSFFSCSIPYQRPYLNTCIGYKDTQVKKNLFLYIHRNMIQYHCIFILVSGFFRCNCVKATTEGILTDGRTRRSFRGLTSCSEKSDYNCF